MKSQYYHVEFDVYAVEGSQEAKNSQAVIAALMCYLQGKDMELANIGVRPLPRCPDNWRTE